MDRNELKALLLREGFPEFTFNVDGTWIEGAVVMTNKGDDWYVKYLEKGVVTHLGHAKSEAEACAIMYDEMHAGYPETPRSR